jgi:V8-like Glu-specific endopeptidase
MHKCDAGKIVDCHASDAQVRVLQQYIDEQSVTPLALNYDFGLITLASPAPNGTTTINIAAGEGSSVKYSLETAGYPADKPAQTMWQVATKP